MALSSPRSRADPRWKYDVFLSFRGEDTRRGFISHLYDALQTRRGIKTFKDDKELETGTSISPSLLTAIEESMSVIVVLSPKYASSSWCLGELTKIVQCMEDKKTIVFPIFYDVDPSDVRYQKRSFAEAFTRHEERFWLDDDQVKKVKEWRTALTKVANLSGLESKNYGNDTELVQDIVEKVCSKVLPNHGGDYLMAGESHDCSVIAKVPGSCALTSSSSDGVIININSGTQDDVVAAVGRDYMKNITVGRDFILYNENPSDVRNQKRSFAIALNTHDERNDTELVQPIVENVCSKVLPHVKFEYTISTGDFEKFVATTQAMNEVKKALIDDKVTSIGIYGMGGVGKTTLAEHVGALARKDGLFDQVIMAVVSQSPDLRKIQGTLADRLGLKLEQETEPVRAGWLKETIMKGNRILIILDDLWKRLELSEVGIPSYDELQRCNSKVIFTTRRLHVCHSMESQASIPLHILSEEDAWKFFVKKARKSFHESTEFYDVGRKVARECAGLPIALVAVARALANQDMEEWKAAARRLEMSQTPNPEEDEDYRGVHESIKLSYDYLRGDDAKRSFLLCCLFPEDSDIPIEDLVRYGFGIGLFRDVINDINTIANARVRANSVAKHLKESSLLLEGKEEGCVRMHDVIRDSAISIASSEGFLVKAGCELKVWPSIIPEGCSAISLMRNWIHKLPHEELVCSKLQILLLRNNSFREIPETFFQGQQNALRVLDASRNGISSLPSSLSFLVNLQALYLDFCHCIDGISVLGNLKKLEILSMRELCLKKLPKEIGHLANLRILDVTAGYVETVPCKVISRLSRLEELYLQCYFRMDISDDSAEEEFSIDSAEEEFSIDSAEEEFNLSFYEFLDLKCLTILKVNISCADSLPKIFGFYSNWVKFNISFCKRSFVLDCWSFDLFSDDYSRTLTLDTTLITLPAWFIEAVTKKTEKLQYVKAQGLSDIVVEHDHGRLQRLKYLSVISPPEELKVLMNTTTTTRVPPNEPVFENLEVLYVYGSSLKELCVGELPNGSLRNLKLLKVEGCGMVNAVVLSNLLQRLHNLETLICEEMCELEYVFETKGLVPEQIVLTTLRHMILRRLYELINIWDGPAPCAIFRNLNILVVIACHELETLLTFDVAQCLSQLEHLWVEYCRGLERVIELPSGETETNKDLVLPKVKGIVLISLPLLTGFYSSTTGSSTIDHIECHSLENLYVEDCPQFSTSVSDFHSRNPVQLRDYDHFIPVSESYFTMALSIPIASASLPPAEKADPRWKHDVFLSFRGVDTRKSITSLLYPELEKRRIKTFMDDQVLEVGMAISPSLLTAIEESRFAIVVLSQYYASSPWCLKEITKIFQCMEDNKFCHFFMMWIHLMYDTKKRVLR